MNTNKKKKKVIKVSPDPIEAYRQGWKDGRADLVEWMENNPPKL
jgi:hypothetical protein